MLLNKSGSEVCREDLSQSRGEPKTISVKQCFCFNIFTFTNWMKTLNQITHINYSVPNSKKKNWLDKTLFLWTIKNDNYFIKGFLYSISNINLY